MKLFFVHLKDKRNVLTVNLASITLVFLLLLQLHFGLLFTCMFIYLFLLVILMVNPSLIAYGLSIVVNLEQSPVICYFMLNSNSLFIPRGIASSLFIVVI